VFLERDRAAETAGFGFGERAGDDLLDVLVGQRLQGEQQRPGQQRGDHGEERVFRGRADERYPAVLHGGQQRVLLGLGKPVHLVERARPHADGKRGGGPGRRLLRLVEQALGLAVTCICSGHSLTLYTMTETTGSSYPQQDVSLLRYPQVPGCPTAGNRLPGTM